MDTLEYELKIKCFKYDPAIKNYSILPNCNVDIVICTDVLQHIPEQYLDIVLKIIIERSNKSFFKIKCTTHPTKLPNGMDANCTVHEENWWIEYLKKYYSNIKKMKCEDETSIILLCEVVNNEL